MNKRAFSAAILSVTLVGLLLLTAWGGIVSATPAGQQGAMAPHAPPTFMADADSWVNEGEPTANYGEDTTLRVGRVLGQRVYFNQQTSCIST